MTELTGEAQVLDVIGNPVGIGDIVAAAFRVGNIAEIRLGKVKGFGERGNALTVRVHWFRRSPGVDMDVDGAIEAELARFVRISA